MDVSGDLDRDLHERGDPEGEPGNETINLDTSLGAVCNLACSKISKNGECEAVSEIGKPNRIITKYHNNFELKLNFEQF